MSDGLFDVISMQIAQPHKIKTVLVNKSKVAADGAVVALTERYGKKLAFEAVAAGEYRDWHYSLRSSEP